MSDLYGPPVDDRGLLPTHVVKQRCGTCSHPHRSEPVDPASFGQWPACDCGCTTFVLHPDELAAMQARQDAERDVFGPGGPLLSADIAEGIRATLCEVEADWHAEVDWDAPPTLGVIMAGRPHNTGQMQPARPGAPAEPLQMMPLVVHYLNVPAGFWGIEGGDVPAAVAGLARMAETQPTLFDKFRIISGLPADMPVIGWWTMTEAYQRHADNPDLRSAKDHPHLAADELRSLTFADVDDRVYEVTRRRSTERQTSGAMTLPQLRATVAEAPAGVQAVMRHSGEGLPIMIDALLRLTRVTCSEAELRHALRAAR